MNKIVLSFFIFAAYVVASSINIDDKINSSKREYKETIKQRKNIDKNIKALGKKILSEEKEYRRITKQIKQTNKELNLNKLELEKAISKINVLKNKLNKLESRKNDIEVNVVHFISEKYAMSMGIQQSSKKSIVSIIDKEVYILVFQNAKKELLELNTLYVEINKSIEENLKTTAKLDKFIKKQKEIQSKFLKMKKKQKKAIKSLKKKHKQYTSNLKTTIQNQYKITRILTGLSIVQKKANIQRVARVSLPTKPKKKPKLQPIVVNKPLKDVSKQITKSSKKNLTLALKSINSSPKNVRVTKYFGIKTVSPLKFYNITKRFGKYYDDVYKMELFSKSVSLQTKKVDAKVINILKGQVVYARHSTGLLKNVVIVKHADKLHTIYSHLDQISPTIEVGKWILKGYVVGRVSDTLVFQATKNSKYIDPLELFQ